MRTSPVEGIRLHKVSDVIAWHVKRLPISDAPPSVERLRILRLFTERFGDCPVELLEADDLIGFLNERKLAIWTKRRWCITLKTPFHKAVSAGRIPFNPIFSASVPQGNRGRDLTRNEWQRLMRGSSPYFRRVLVFLRFTGCRPGEMRQLRWDNIHEDVRAAIFEKHKTSNTQAVKKPRRIALNNVAMKLLAWIRRNDNHSDYVLLSRDGLPWSCSALTCYMRRLRKRIGLPKDVKNYGCRHAFGTGAIMNDVGLATLAELMGHNSTKTTEYYIHLSGKADHLSAAAEMATSKLT